MAAVEHSAVHPVGVQMLLGDRYPGCAARPWATMFNRVAVVVRAIAKFWNLELGTWNLEPGLGLTGEASAGLVLRGWKPTTRPTYAQARGQRDLPDSSAAHRGRDS